MTYIPENQRQQLRAKYVKPRTPSELNYTITAIILDYLERDRDWDGVESYDAYNDAIGVLECAKLELYRRRTAVYEDKKCAMNGDVYALD